MAEQFPQGHGNSSTVVTSPPRAEAKDERGCFDFILRKNDEKIQEDEVVMTDHVNGTGKGSRDDKHAVMDELRRAHSHSISSSDEDVDEGGERRRKKKKSLKAAFKEKISGDRKEDEDTMCNDDNAPMEKCSAEEENANTLDDDHHPEEKKGFLEKMKEKIPGHHKKAEQQNQTPNASENDDDKAKEKKGIMDMIKDKLPGQHNSIEKDVKKIN